MEVKQLYTNCLSEAAYFIASEGEAAVIDPLRDVDVYLQMAKERGVTIKYIFETHFHADFVSGHIELAQKTGAPIIPLFFLRTPEDRFYFRLGKPIYPPALDGSHINDEEIEKLIQKYLPLVEEQIRLTPCQWLMFRRFESV